MSNENKNNQENNSNDNTKKRDFILDGQVNEESTRKLAEKIIEINRFDDEKFEKDISYRPQPIKIIVNTSGGSVYDGNMLVSVMETSKTEIHTYCFGKAMSMGLPIFLAGHKRFASQLAYFMYHDVSFGAYDTVEGVKATLQQSTNLRDMMDLYVITKSNLPKSLMDEHKRLKEDLYITASQALEFGIVDEIVKFPKR